jgi:predicted nucleic acid-binding protein
MKLYVDTNILLQDLIDHPDSGAVAGESFRFQSQGHTLVSSVLTAVEIDRVLLRHGGSRTQITATLLRGFDLLAITPAVLDLARVIPVQFLKTLDSLHLATAVISRCDAVITMDQQLAQACAEIGLAVA